MSTTQIRSHGSGREEPVVSRDQHVRVLIADPDGLARRLMQDTLQEAEEPMMAVAASDAREALELAGYYRPAVLLLATTLLPAGCVELIGKVLLVSPETRILTVSANGDDETALAALRAGAVGHISKDVDPGDLARLVVQAAEGQGIVPQRLIMPLLELLREVPDAGWRPLRSRLTTREWEVVDMLAEGASTDQIAASLVLSPSTVYSHVKSLLRKLGVHSRCDAVAAAECLRRQEALGTKLPIPVQ